MPDKQFGESQEKSKQLEKEAWEAKYKKAGVFSKAGMKIKKGFQGLKQTGVDTVLNMKDDFMESHNKAYHGLKAQPEKYESLPWYKKVGHVLANPAAHIHWSQKKKKMRKAAALGATPQNTEMTRQKDQEIPEAPLFPEELIPKLEGWEEKAYHDAAKQTIRRWV